MKLSTQTKLNEHQGDQNIEVLIPLMNRDAGKFQIYTSITSPSGKRITELTSENSKKKFTLTKISGIDYVSFTIPLKKNPEEGEYILESFEIQTLYDRPSRPFLPLDQNNIADKKIKLLERGIRKTFTISEDRIIRLN
jgi:hypothetical protein